MMIALSMAATALFISPVFMLAGWIRGREAITAKIAFRRSSR